MLLSCTVSILLLDIYIHDIPIQCNDYKSYVGNER